MFNLEKSLLLENIKKNGNCVIRVGGNCMKPIIKNEALVIIEKKIEYKINDIIAYFVSDQLFVHRIIELRRNQFIMMGDIGNFNKHIIELKDVLGKIIKIKNKNKLIRILEKFKWKKKRIKKNI